MEIFRFTRGSRIESLGPFWSNDSSSSRAAISKSFCELNRIHTGNFVGSWPRLCLIPSALSLSLFISLDPFTHIHTHTYSSPCYQRGEHTRNFWKISPGNFPDIFPRIIETSRRLYRALRFNLINRRDALINSNFAPPLNLTSNSLSSNSSSTRCDSIRRDNIWTVCNFQPTRGRANGCRNFLTYSWPFQRESGQFARHLSPPCYFATPCPAFYLNFHPRFPLFFTHHHLQYFPSPPPPPPPCFS